MGSGGLSGEPSEIEVPEERSAGSLAPIYKRLPHGPHRLDRSDVVRHQRARIHGAMIEAVARNGYEDTTIKQVIGLAGVSRKSFYEQFENKRECFLATFDVIAAREARRARDTYLGTDGGRRERLEAVFAAWEAAMHEERAAASFVLREIHKTGPTGTAHVCRAAAVFEQMLGDVLLQGRHGTPPAPLVRGVTGGLHWVLSSAVSSPEDPTRDLTQELLEWSLPFRSLPAEDVVTVLSKRLRDRVRRISASNAHTRTLAPDSGEESTRIEQSVLKIASREHPSELSAARIADSAAISIERFFELFDTPGACLDSALAATGRELLAAVAEQPQTEPWASATCRRCALLLNHLAERPLQARALVQDSYSSGELAIARHVELSEALGRLLADGAPPETRRIVSLGAVGALWHTLRHQVANGRVSLLAALPDHLAYVVLTPAIGAEAAWQTIAATPAG